MNNPFAANGIPTGDARPAAIGVYVGCRAEIPMMTQLGVGRFFSDLFVLVDLAIRMLASAQTARSANMIMRRGWKREIDMNVDRWTGIFRQFKGRFGELNIDPLAAAAGRRERLAGRIQEQRGIVKEATERALDDFLARNRNWRRLSSR